MGTRLTSPVLTGGAVARKPRCWKRAEMKEGDFQKEGCNSPADRLVSLMRSKITVNMFM